MDCIEATLQRRNYRALEINWLKQHGMDILCWHLSMFRFKFFIWIAFTICRKKASNVVNENPKAYKYIFVNTYQLDGF